MNPAITLTLYCLFFLNVLQGQNLVPNGNFEIKSYCPTFNGIAAATGWSNANKGTCDYFHPCANGNGIGPGVPENYLGQQAPRSGNGYGGFIAYLIPSVGSIDGYEYLKIDLSRSLQAGQSYYFEMYLSLGEQSGFACNNIGMYLTDAFTARNDEYRIPLTPVIQSSHIYSDSLNWEKYSGTFTAKGGEKVMIIGNFSPYASTQTFRTLGQPSFACYYVDDVLLKRNCDIITQKLIRDTTICEGASALLDASLNIPDAAYMWQDGSDSPKYEAKYPGQYKVKINFDGCQYEDSAVIHVNRSPIIDLGHDTAICYGDPLTLDTKQHFTSYAWNNGTTLPKISVSNFGVFSVTVMDSNGCSTRDSLAVVDKCKISIYIPNAFTPNDDLLNDIFLPFYQNIKTIHLSIYDRWGKLLFETTDKQKGWTGRENGVIIQPDVYIYNITYEEFDNQIKTISGNVTLLK